MKKEKKEFKKRKILKTFFTIFFLTTILLTLYYISTTVFTWTGPPENPLGGNVDLTTECEPFGFGCVDCFPYEHECAAVTIGGECQGGKVAYHDGQGGGIIAATADNSTSIDWGCSGTSVGASGTAVGTGVSNTAAILAGCATRPIAASVCDTYAGGGYGDWYLPSQDELGWLFASKGAVGGYDISGTFYWSSSEFSTTNALRQRFSDGWQGNIAKTNTYRVRCIRAFGPPQVGDEYGGGIIGYLDGSGGGIIAATADNSTSIQWGCRGQSVGSTSTAIGTGLANTNAIVAFHDGWASPYSTFADAGPGDCNVANDGTVAARVCADLSSGGYDDWFLPSKDELNAIFCHIGSDGTETYWNDASHANCTQYPDFSSTLDANGNIGNFAATYYWSSSEDTTNNAWVQYFINGFQATNSKHSTYRVRCIRAI